MEIAGPCGSGLHRDGEIRTAQKQGSHPCIVIRSQLLEKHQRREGEDRPSGQGCPPRKPEPPAYSVQRRASGEDPGQERQIHQLIRSDKNEVPCLKEFRIDGEKTDPIRRAWKVSDRRVLDDIPHDGKMVGDIVALERRQKPSPEDVARHQAGHQHAEQDGPQGNPDFSKPGDKRPVPVKNRRPMRADSQNINARADQRAHGSQRDRPENPQPPQNQHRPQNLPDKRNLCRDPCIQDSRRSSAEIEIPAQADRGGKSNQKENTGPGEPGCSQ